MQRQSHSCMGRDGRVQNGFLPNVNQCVGPTSNTVCCPDNDSSRLLWYLAFAWCRMSHSSSPSQQYALIAGGRETAQHLDQCSQMLAQIFRRIPTVSFHPKPYHQSVCRLNFITTGTTARACGTFHVPALQTAAGFLLGAADARHCCTGTQQHPCRPPLHSVRAAAAVDLGPAARGGLKTGVGLMSGPENGLCLGCFFRFRDRSKILSRTS